MTELTTRELSDPATLTRLLQHAPPGGVLSIYVNADSGSDPGLRATAIDIRNRLSELERNIEAEGPPERAGALSARLRRLTPEVERITSPRERGRGRILFASLDDGETTRVTSQMPVANRVVLDATAFVHPLLELLDEGRPAGVVLASQDAARLLEWRLGELRELERLLPEVVEASHERPGPVGSSPAERTYTPKREQRAARESARTPRFLDRVADAAHAIAAGRGWERLVVSGGERLTEPLAQAFAAPLQSVLIRDRRVLIQFDEAALSETITGQLHAQHAEDEARLLHAVRDAALGSGTGALGLSEVVGALNEARVAHFVYDPEIRYQGTIAADGTLQAADERGAADATPEPRLTERLVERALETSARVSPVEGASRGVLADAGGIAALLRW